MTPRGPAASNIGLQVVVVENRGHTTPLFLIDQCNHRRCFFVHSSVYLVVEISLHFAITRDVVSRFFFSSSMNTSKPSCGGLETSIQSIALVRVYQSADSFLRLRYGYLCFVVSHYFTSSLKRPINFIFVLRIARRKRVHPAHG